MRTAIVALAILALTTFSLLAQCEGEPTPIPKGRVAAAFEDAPSQTVVTSEKDTYVGVLTDQEGNLSMFAQQPLVSVAADGVMAKKAAIEWGWDLSGSAVMYGMLAAHELVGRDAYLDYVKTWANRHIGDGIRITSAEQCTPGMAMIALYEQTKDKKYLAMAKTLADFLLSNQPATANGETSYAPNRRYIDVMLLTGPFLAKFGEITGNYRYQDAGADQIIKHIDYLRKGESTKNLFSQIYDFNGPKKFPYMDDGGQGWIFLQIAETADIVPEEHPKKPKLAYILSNQGCATLSVSPMVFGKAAGSLTISYSHAAYTYGASKLLSGEI